MRMPNVRTNRVLLGVVSGAMLGVGLIASAGLMASPRESPLLMQVLGPEMHESSALLDSAAPLPHAERAWDEPGATADADTGVTHAGASAGDTIERDAAAQDHEALRWFNGRPVRPARTVRMTVTAYSPDERSCGAHADGITASGYSVWTNGMKLVAADTSLLPFGSLVTVPGYGEEGEIVPVLDRGGKIKGHRLDVLYATHQAAIKWGVRELDVVIWEYADGLPNGFRTSHRR